MRFAIVIVLISEGGHFGPTRFPLPRMEAPSWNVSPKTEGASVLGNFHTFIPILNLIKGESQYSTTEEHIKSFLSLTSMFILFESII